MIRHCQMSTKEGLEECGFLVGAKCMADPKKPFVVDSSFHERIKIVGCESYQRYMDYEQRRKLAEPSGEFYEGVETEQPPREKCKFCDRPAVLIDVGVPYCQAHAKKMGLLKE